MQKANNKNRQQLPVRAEQDLEKLIRTFTRQHGIEDKDPSEFILDNPDDYKSLLNHIAQGQGQNYLDEEDILAALDYAFAKTPNPSPHTLYQTLSAQLSTVAEEWICVFPLDFSGFIQPQLMQPKRKIQIGSFLLVPARETYESLNKLLQEEFGSSQLDKGLFDHQTRYPSTTLTKRPLMCFRLKGSHNGVPNVARTKFGLFKTVSSLFISLEGRRNPTFTSAESLTYHFFMVSKHTGKVYRWPFRFGTRILVDPDSRLWQKLRTNGIVDFMDWVENDKIPKRMRNAIHFLSKGFDETDDLTRFVFNIIALESLFSKDRYTQIRTTIADCVSLLCYPKSGRVEVHKRMRDLYDIRSKIVHQGETVVGASEVEDAQAFAAKAIVNSVKLFMTLTPHGTDDEKFFDRLLKLKLGI